MNRFQVVVVNGISSIPKCLDFGVRISARTNVIVLYTQLTLRIVRRCGCDLHKFSGDTQFFIFAPSADFGTLVQQTEQCVETVTACMGSNMFKRNDDKTVATVVGTRSRTNVFCGEHLEVDSHLIPFSAKG